MRAGRTVGGERKKNAARHCQLPSRQPKERRKRLIFWVRKKEGVRATCSAMQERGVQFAGERKKKRGGRDLFWHERKGGKKESGVSLRKKEWSLPPRAYLKRKKAP